MVKEEEEEEEEDRQRTRLTVSHQAVNEKEDMM